MRRKLKILKKPLVCNMLRTEFRIQNSEVRGQISDFRTLNQKPETLNQFSDVRPLRPARAGHPAKGRQASPHLREGLFSVYRLYWREGFLVFPFYNSPPWQRRGMNSASAEERGGRFSTHRHYMEQSLLAFPFL